jgi:uncharacterized protein YecT (DUF1311 family)
MPRLTRSKQLPATFLRIAIPFSLLLVLPGFVRAQCGDKKTAVEIVDCVKIEVKRADVELNQVYQAKLKKLRQPDAERLRKAQRAWLVYRDAECDAEMELYAGGSIAPQIRLNCELTVTRLRIREIETAYENH